MKKACLSDICSITMGQSPDSSTYNDNGNGLPFFQGNADFGNRNPHVRVWCSEPKKIAHQDDILISVRAPIGALNIANQECCIGRGLAALSVKPEYCLQEYLWYYLCNAVDELNAKGTGSTFKAINKNVLAELSVRLFDLKVQQRIVLSLNKLTELINQSKRSISKLDELIKSRFVEMFGDITQSELYPYKRVQDFTTIVSGGTPNRDNDEYWKDGNIPWVKTTELQHSEIENTEECITEKGLTESSAKIVPPGTVLIAMYGQGKTRGMTGLLKIAASTNQACACILPCNEINFIYLWKFFELSYNNLRDLAKGGNQPNLNSALIKNYPVLFPPKNKQNKFADLVTKVDQQKSTVQKSIDKLETLKKSLMQEYFG